MGKTLQDGILLVRCGDLDGAVAIFRALLAQDPKHAPAHLWLANCHVLQGDLKQAKQGFVAASAHGEPEVQHEARRQLYGLWYNRVMRILVLDPPLRHVLLMAAILFLSSLGFRGLGWDEAAGWSGFLSIWMLLPLFFLWASFLLSYFVGNLAFGPMASGSSARTARLAIVLAGVFVLPANLLLRYGTGVALLAVMLDVFLVSLSLSRMLTWLGRKFATELNPFVLDQLVSSMPDTNKSNQEF